MYRPHKFLLPHGSKGATIAANTKIDRGVEAIINGALNVVLFFIVIAFFYIDPWELAASLTGIVLAFAFMIGR